MAGSDFKLNWSIFDFCVIECQSWVNGSGNQWAFFIFLFQTIRIWELSFYRSNIWVIWDFLEFLWIFLKGLTMFLKGKLSACFCRLFSGQVWVNDFWRVFTLGNKFWKNYSILPRHWSTCVNFCEFYFWVLMWFKNSSSCDLLINKSWENKKGLIHVLKHNCH